MIRIEATDCFILIIITSQKKKRVAYYQKTPKPEAAKCLVDINNDDFSYLTKESAIDCNAAEYLSIKEIVHKVEETKGFEIECEPIEAYLRKEIVSAIMKSPLLNKFIKNLAKASNPL